MKVSTFTSLLFSLANPSLAMYHGYNHKPYTADGVTCKTRSDWKDAFSAVKRFPNDINAARLFYAAECDSLANAVPEAIASGTQILVGLDDGHANFAAEKGALIAAIREHGWSWLVGVSVGSESLYRGDISPYELADKINDVKGMLPGLPGYPGRKVEVGHVDTTNEWLYSSNKAVLVACDFIGMDIYPYFQTDADNHISNARALFSQAIEQARASITAAGSHASVWVAETGWPVSGNKLGAAVPGVSQAASYFQQVACPYFGNINLFWFAYQEWFASPNFAVVDAHGQQYFDQNCPSGERRAVGFQA